MGFGVTEGQPNKWLPRNRQQGGRRGNRTGGSKNWIPSREKPVPQVEGRASRMQDALTSAHA